MSDNYEVLLAKAQAAQSEHDWHPAFELDGYGVIPSFRSEDAEFIAAASPEVVERLIHDRNWWEQNAIGWHDDCQQAWKDRDANGRLWKLAEEETQKARAERDEWKQAAIWEKAQRPTDLDHILIVKERDELLARLEDRERERTADYRKMFDLRDNLNAIRTELRRLASDPGIHEKWEKILLDIAEIGE